jgi:hypothetical protein
MSVSCECCVLSGRGLCAGLITHPEESYRLCVYLIVCDLETSTMRRPRPELGCCAIGKNAPWSLHFTSFSVHLYALILPLYSVE